MARHFVPAANTPQLIARLSEGLHPDSAIAGLAASLQPASLNTIVAEIDDAFSAQSVEEVGKRREAGDGSWSRTAYLAFGPKSPTSQKIAFRQLTMGHALDFNDCMRMEYRICQRILLGHDFYEGVRATILDRKAPPRWQPLRLEDVREEDVAGHFSPVTHEL